MNIQALDFHNFGTSVLNWFHPAVTRLHDGRLLATIQVINGSDCYGSPSFSISSDMGRNWSLTEEIPAFKSRRLPGLPFIEGVADIRPFTLQDGTVAVFGCTTFYTDKGCATWDKGMADSLPAGRAVYALWSPETGKWSERGILPLPGVERTYRTACTQAVLMEKDQILLPIYLDSGTECDYFGQRTSRFASMTALYRNRGMSFEPLGQSLLLELPVLRGCIEPSAIRLASGEYALTLRAEDGRMYCSTSADGLAWREIRPWRWDDGRTIETSSTQQHWLQLGGKTYLVYTRHEGDNDKIMRFRAPLFIAEADAADATLCRSSEMILFPRQSRDGIECLYGNFHCTQLDDSHALVTDCALFTEVRNDVMHHSYTLVQAALVSP